MDGTIVGQLAQHTLYCGEQLQPILNNPSAFKASRLANYTINDVSYF